MSERPPGPSSVGGTPVIVRAATHADAEAIQSIYLPIVKDTAIGYVSLFAGIALPNRASVGLHETVGSKLVEVFWHVGYKYGCWYDVGWWQRSLHDPPVPPSEPREWRPTG